MVQDFVEYILIVGCPNVWLRRVMAGYGYAVRPVILILFLYIISPKKKYTWA